MTCVECDHKCQEYLNNIVSDKAYFEWSLKLDKCKQDRAESEEYEYRKKMSIL